MTTVSAADNDTIYVNGSHGNDSWDGLSWTTAKLSIKNATGTVNPNGKINIANGNYSGINNTEIAIDKNMTIIGESQTGTTINGTNTNWIFNIASGVNVTLQNLTITNGNTTTSYCALSGGIRNYGILAMMNCNIENNTATSSDSSGLTYGGGIYNLGTLIMTSCNVINNTAQSYGFWDWSSAYGGGIYNEGTLTMASCNVANNIAIATGTGTSAKGGGIDNEGTLTMKSCNVINNTAYSLLIYALGGGIWNGGTLNITSCNIINNTAIQTYGTGWGGGIGSAGTLIANFNRIMDNTPTAIYLITEGDVEDNWWGSNNPNWSNLIFGFTNPTNWVILTVNATPTTINNTQTSTITADFSHINGGGDLTGGHILDGPITLQIPWGSFTSSGVTHSITMNTINSLVSATFFANEGMVPFINPVKVTATADNYTTNNTESAYITINKTTDLYIKITNNKNNPKVGETFTITYKLGNKGPDSATNVTITIPLPQGFKITSISGDGVWTYNANTNTITWTFTNVLVGDPYLYISGHVNKLGAYVFGSSISSETYNINTEGVTPVTINAVSQVKVASKTIPMQETGLPISGLILAILTVFGGLAGSKRK